MTLNFHYLIFGGNFLPSLKSPCVAGGHGSAIDVLSIAARKVIMQQAGVITSPSLPFGFRDGIG